MSKTSVSNGNDTETVFSETSCGGYVTADDEVELINYLVHLPSKSDFIVEIGLEEDLNERVNGGNSNYDGDDACEFDNSKRRVELEMSHASSPS